jgi:hypothetical protein
VVIVEIAKMFLVGVGVSRRERARVTCFKRGGIGKDGGRVWDGWCGRCACSVRDKGRGRRRRREGVGWRRRRGKRRERHAEECQGKFEEGKTAAGNTNNGWGSRLG